MAVREKGHYFFIPFPSTHALGTAPVPAYWGMWQIHVLLLIKKIFRRWPVLLAGFYIYFRLLYKVCRYLKCSRILDSNCDWTLKSAGFRSLKTSLILSFHGTVELKARRNEVLTPSFKSNPNILFPFSHSTHKSAFSVPHSLSGCGEALYNRLWGHGSWFNHSFFLCPIPALMRSDFTHLSALNQPHFAWRLLKVLLT